MSQTIKCPRCKRIPTKLVPVNDNDTGIKICRDCKKRQSLLDKKFMEVQ